MTPFEVFLIPGQFVVGFILDFLQTDTTVIEPTLITIFAGLISWVFWMAIIRAAWAITLKIFGFGPRRPY